MKMISRRRYANLMVFALVGLVGALPTFVGNASAAPSIPQGLAAEAGDRFVRCSWQAVPEANVTYALYRGHAESSNLVAIASNLTATAHVDTSAVNGTAYRYAVTAKDATGESGRSTHALANPVGKRNVLIFYAVWANNTTKSINPGTGDCWIMTQAYSGYPAWNWWGKPLYAAITGDRTIKNNYKMYFGTPNTPNNALLDWHATLLSEAGVDAVVLDLTNGTQTDMVDGAKALCKRFSERRALGLPTPKVIIWSKDEATLQHMKTNVMDVSPPEVFFDYLGKKLICANDTGAGSPAVPTNGLWGNFTSRRMWALGAVGTTGKIWSFKTAYSTPPSPFMYNGEPEQMAAVVATQSSRMTEDGVNPAPGAVGRQNGAFFNTYMDAAIAAGPRFLFVHSWNEWTAQNLHQTPGMAQFVDQWRTEYSSDVEPMDGGHGWDYYNLMKLRLEEYKDVAPTVMVLATDANAVEPADNGTFTFTRSGATAEALTVNFTVGGTATAGADYSNIGNSVTFAAGQSSTNRIVLVMPDATPEFPETVVVTLNSNANYTIGSPGSATVNISDNDVAGEAVPWLVNFNGLATGTTNQGSPTTWTATRGGTFWVSDDRLAVNSAGGEGVFTSGVINISSGSVNLSLDVLGAGGLDVGEDYVRLYIKVNGGAELLVNGVTGPQLTATTWTTNGITGNTLQVVIRTLVTAPSEFYYLDNLRVVRPLPNPWLTADIGAVAVGGSASFNSSTWTISGSGSDISGTADGCQFVYQPRAGDGYLTARVVGQTPTDIWAKAGVMIRESTAEGARNAMMLLSASNGLSFQRRVLTNGSTDSTTQGPAGVAPYWVRLVRSGASFTGYASTDGGSWTLIGATNIAGFSANALWGMAVTAHNNTQLSTATFDNVAINQWPSPAAISNRTITAGQTLVITNGVTDADVPAQAFAWNSLAAPANSQLDPASGRFTWRPTMEQSPSTNLVSLSVTDNGSPALAATQSFSVFVLRPAQPGISAPSFSNGVFSLTVSGDTGPDYGLFASTNLTNWLLLQQTNPPVLPFRFVDPAATNFDRRFYRVQLSP